MEKAERRKQFLELYSQGKNLQQISKIFGISGERTRQIIISPEYYDLRRKKREEALARRFRRYNCKQCGSLEITSSLTQEFCSTKCWSTFKRAQYVQTLDQIKEKRCRWCLEVKSASEFYIHREGVRRYLYPHCKTCHCARTSLWAKQHPERYKEIMKRASTRYWQKKKLLTFTN